MNALEILRNDSKFTVLTIKEAESLPDNKFAITFSNDLSVHINNEYHNPIPNFDDKALVFGNVTWGGIIRGLITVGSDNINIVYFYRPENTPAIST